MIVTLDVKLAAGENMELLAPLEDFLRKKSQDYEVRHYQAQKFLKVTQFRPHGLKYLPNFHLIFQVMDSESLSMSILTYHGRTLSTFFFKGVSALSLGCNDVFFDIMLDIFAGHPHSLAG